MQGFGADGIPLMSNTDVVRSLIGWARQLNPAAGITLPGGAPVDVKNMDARHAELTKMIGQDGSAYWKGPQAGELQEEWRKLDTAIREMKKKGGINAWRTDFGGFVEIACAVSGLSGAAEGAQSAASAAASFASAREAKSTERRRQQQENEQP